MEDGSGAVSPSPGPSLTLGQEPNEPVASTAADRTVVKIDAPTHHFTKFLPRWLQIGPTPIRPPMISRVFITGRHPAKSLMEDRI
jgi:hypothetical protein